MLSNNEWSRFLSTKGLSELGRSLTLFLWLGGVLIIIGTVGAFISESAQSNTTFFWRVLANYGMSFSFLAALPTLLLKVIRLKNRVAMWYSATVGMMSALLVPLLMYFFHLFDGRESGGALLIVSGIGFMGAVCCGRISYWLLRGKRISARYLKRQDMFVLALAGIALMSTWSLREPSLVPYSDGISMTTACAALGLQFAKLIYELGTMTKNEPSE